MFMGNTPDEKKLRQPMINQNENPAIMLAPCGMNCAVCYVHLRKKKQCLGCRNQDGIKPEHCRKCKIKDCMLSQGTNFCFECASFPCGKIKNLDKSYCKRYQVSLIENGLRLKTMGEESYLRAEMEKWRCTFCGGIISLHDHVCSQCGREVFQS
jgi:hypothetical protein